MTRQLYDLRHPLYPNPDLLKYYEDHKMTYTSSQGSYDAAYNNWYQLVRADHDISGSPIRPIYSEVSQIIRLKAGGKDKILYSENLYGQDHEFVQQPFFHTYGSYNKPGFRTLYNYETKVANTVPTGQLETIYFIDYSKQKIDDLYKASPDDMDIEFLVNVGSKQYGSRGFYTLEEFRDMELEDLARLGRDGKGMFKQVTAKVSTNEMAAELYNTKSTVNPQQEAKLYEEFQAYKKWKQSEPIIKSDKEIKK